MRDDILEWLYYKIALFTGFRTIGSLQNDRDETYFGSCVQN